MRSSKYQENSYKHLIKEETKGFESPWERWEVASEKFWIRTDERKKQKNQARKHQVIDQTTKHKIKPRTKEVGGYVSTMGLWGENDAWGALLWKPKTKMRKVAFLGVSCGLSHKHLFLHSY